MLIIFQKKGHDMKNIKKWLYASVAAALIMCTSTQPDSTGMTSIRRFIQELQQEIQELNTQLADAKAKLAAIINNSSRNPQDALYYQNRIQDLKNSLQTKYKELVEFKAQL